MAGRTVLLVDDDAAIRDTLSAILLQHGYIVTAAGSVSEALRFISTCTFDVLLSDLHMPGKGDGLTVVSAMRHANPNAVTMLLSAFPDLDAGAQAILLQADQILIKPLRASALIEAIEQRLSLGASPARLVESVATVLEHSIQSIVDAWLARVQSNEKLLVVAMSQNKRTGHVPVILADLVRLLRSSGSMGAQRSSPAAEKHGCLRRHQGYSASMLVEESRMLQVSIFETLQKNFAVLDFSLLLTDVMSIADEVDSQLSQAMDSYEKEIRQPAITA